MNLEDHLGDILSKSRQSAKISLEEAAQAAGLSSNEYLQLERAGKIERVPNLTAVAELLGLDPQKLEQIDQGWLPSEKDLTRWRELRQVTSSSGSLEVHCYLIWDEVTREAALFDTGFDAGAIFQILDEHQLQLRHIFITHSHHDHLAALPEIRQRFSKTRLHSNSKQAPVDQRNRPNDFIHLGSLRITNRDTPGHAEDGVAYVVGNWPEDAENVAFVGDAIFAGSMGGARENAPLAKQKVRDQIFSLPPGTLLCPGHGPLTTVEEERQHNPFFV